MPTPNSTNLLLMLYVGAGSCFSRPGPADLLFACQIMPKVRQRGAGRTMTEEAPPQVLLTATGFAAREALAVLRKHKIATAAFFRPPSIGAASRKPVRRSTTIAGRSWSRDRVPGSTPKTAPRSCALGRTRVERRRDGLIAWGIFEDAGDLGRYEEVSYLHSSRGSRPQAAFARAGHQRRSGAFEDEIREMLIAPPRIEFLIAAELLAMKARRSSTRGASRSVACEFLSSSRIRWKRVSAFPRCTRASSRCCGPADISSTISTSMRRSSTRSCRGRDFFATSIQANANTRGRSKPTFSACGLAKKRSSSYFPSGSTAYPRSCRGYFQRAMFLPGVSEIRASMRRGCSHPNLRTNIKRLAAVCAYGESRARDVAAKGDPPLRFVRDERWRADGSIRKWPLREYLALYDMELHRARSARRAAFMKRMTRAFEAW